MGSKMPPRLYDSEMIPRAESRREWFREGSLTVDSVDSRWMEVGRPSQGMSSLGLEVKVLADYLGEHGFKDLSHSGCAVENVRFGI